MGVRATRPVTRRASADQDVTETDQGLAATTTTNRDVTPTDPGTDRRLSDAGDDSSLTRWNQGVDVARTAGQLAEIRGMNRRLQ